MIMVRSRRLVAVMRPGSSVPGPPFWLEPVDSPGAARWGLTEATSKVRASSGVWARAGRQKRKRIASFREHLLGGTLQG
jgi:hypothetical protein